MTTEKLKNYTNNTIYLFDKVGRGGRLEATLHASGLQLKAVRDPSKWGEPGHLTCDTGLEVPVVRVPGQGAWLSLRMKREEYVAASGGGYVLTSVESEYPDPVHGAIVDPDVGRYMMEQVAAGSPLYSDIYGVDTSPESVVLGTRGEHVGYTCMIQYVKGKEGAV